MPQFTAGTEIRITVGSRTVSGAIDRITDDSVAITAGKGQEMFDRPQVSSVSAKKPGHRMRNALIGLGAEPVSGSGSVSVSVSVPTSCTSCQTPRLLADPPRRGQSS